MFLLPAIAVEDYNVLSTLIFNDFSTEVTAMIVIVTSDAADEHQCYWYARVIYNIIVEMQAEKYTKAPLVNDKRDGRLGMMKIVNDSVSSISCALLVPQNSWPTPMLRE